MKVPNCKEDVAWSRGQTSKWGGSGRKLQFSNDSYASSEGAKCELKLGCFLIRKVVARESCQDGRDGNRRVAEDLVRSRLDLERGIP